MSVVNSRRRVKKCLPKVIGNTVMLLAHYINDCATPSSLTKGHLYRPCGLHWALPYVLKKKNNEKIQFCLPEEKASDVEAYCHHLSDEMTFLSRQGSKCHHTWVRLLPLHISDPRACWCLAGPVFHFDYCQIRRLCVSSASEQGMGKNRGKQGKEKKNDNLDL